MDVIVDVVGEDTETLSVDEGSTYADLVRAVDLSVNEVTVLVDGSPVPEDRPVTTDRVRVLRLIKGGAASTRTIDPPVAADGPCPFPVSRGS